MAARMDLSFARRKQQLRPGTPDLASLLAVAAARAATAPTARVQARLDGASQVTTGDPRVAIFASDASFVARVHRFSDLAQNIVSARQ